MRALAVTACLVVGCATAQRPVARVRGPALDVGSGEKASGKCSKCVKPVFTEKERALTNGVLAQARALCDRAPPGPSCELVVKLATEDVADIASSHGSR